ncbi:MAG TPA: hypothetical protein VJV23_17065 [Candidatus Polarisedimenticolia bacterium]|nr:hypothetical protein [Candidatus Polarisedimenticolia bacterium]
MMAAALLAGLVAADAPPVPPRFLGVRTAAIVAEHIDGTPFAIPQGVHYDLSRDELFVADTGNAMVGIFDGRGVPKHSFPTGPDVTYPVALATDEAGDIYVLSAGARFIAVYSYRGEPARRIPLEDVDGTRVAASGMGMSPDGRLHVLDAPGGRVLVLGTDGSLARVVRGSGPGGLRLQAPSDIAFDRQGRSYVSDRRGMPVQVYDSAGRYLHGWGRRDLGAQDFATPSGIAVDEHGLVLVSDPLRQDVKIFDSQGTFQDRFGGFGGRPGSVAYPTDVAAGRGGIVYVVERVGRRVQVFLRLTVGDGPKHPAEGAPAAGRPLPAR